MTTYSITNHVFRPWWAPLWTYALSSAVFLGLVPALPLVLLNSRSLTLFLLIFAAAAIPPLLAIAHGASLRLAMILNLLAALGIVLFWPEEQLGNWTMQIAGHVQFWAFAGFVAGGIAQAIFLKRHYRGELHDV